MFYEPWHCGQVHLWQTDGWPAEKSVKYNFTKRLPDYLPVRKRFFLKHTGTVCGFSYFRWKWETVQTINPGQQQKEEGLLTLQNSPGKLPHFTMVSTY